MKAAASLVAAVVLAGCAQPKLLRHYDAMDDGALARHVELSVFVANPSGAQSASVLAGLGERGQAELISALAAKIPAKAKPEDLIELLRTPPKQSEPPCGWAVNASATRQLVISLLGDLRKPADRVDKLDLVLTLRSPGKDKNGVDIPPRARFVSWDRFQSVPKTYDIGTATVTQSNKLTLGGSREGTSNLAESAGSLVKALNLGAETDRTWEESAKYGLTRLSVGGSLTPTTARLVQEGGPYFSLFGASEATITMSLELNPDPHAVYTFSLQKDGRNLSATDVSVTRCADRFPISSQEIVADVSGTILLREVLSGDDTVAEGDDHVRLSREAIKGEPVRLVTKDSLELARFGLGRCPERGTPKGCHVLQIQHDGAANAEAEPVILASEADAIALRSWLSTQSKSPRTRSIGGLAIGVGRRDAPLSAAELSGVSASKAARLRVISIPSN